MSDKLLICMSSAPDGSMSKGVTQQEKQANRNKFLNDQGIPPSQTVLVHLTYETTDFCRYITVSTDQAGDGITQQPSLVADAVFTREKNIALFLPVADCIAAVLYDPEKQVLGLAHLGRHNLEQSGGRGIAHYMQEEFGSRPTAIQVWLSPAAGRSNYPLYNFENHSLHEVAIEQLMSAGIPLENIVVDDRDTTTDHSLFSHSEFLKGNRKLDGRQAAVCMIRP